MIYAGESPMEAVRVALKELQELEQEIVIRYHFMGETHKEIGQIFDLDACRVRQIRQKSLARLKVLLSPFVNRRYGVVSENEHYCPLCVDRRLDNLIDRCGPYGPWTPVFREMERMKFTKVRSVSTIQFHFRNHLWKGRGNE